MNRTPFRVIVATSVLLLAVVILREVAAGSEPVPVDYSKTSPANLVMETPKGKLHNPFKDSDKKIVAQGQTLFRSYPCSGCHGGDAGGGMCPPLTSAEWIYGGDDDTLFRLVTLGSDQLQKDGYTRGFGQVVGPMPPMGPLFSNSEDLWKILTFIRSRYDGDPAYKYGNPPSSTPAED